MVKMSDSIDKASFLISTVKGKNVSSKELAEKAIDLAALMLKESQSIQTSEEKSQQEFLARMMKDPTGKIFTTCFTDQCFRSQSSRRIADQLCFLLKKFGIPKFPPAGKRFGLKLFKLFGKFFSPLLVPAIKNLLRKETANVILPGEPIALTKHMQNRQREGVRVNLNHLGEAILGEDEALHRLNTYLEDLARPDVEYISVKISTIYSQLNLLAWDATLQQLSERLRQLYSASTNHFYLRSDGTKIQKFVNLDMEEYRDLHLTVELFCKVLSEKEFHSLSAGIVLQSYLPDSFSVQQKLTEWAIERVANGGAPIKIRIVKGANLAMEQVEASLRNWPQAPYDSKEDVDANYKKMVEYGCLPTRTKAVHLGIASHNLLDIAYALLLRSQNNVEACVSFEMLEGMADHIRRTVQAIAGDILLYCPVAKKEEFQNAVAYLVRRLDENTAPENFLRALFNLRIGSPEWKYQTQLFTKSLCKAEILDTNSKRTQNRQNPPEELNLYAAFDNEPDTDWSLPQNIEWANNIIKDLSSLSFDFVPLTIAGSQRPGENGEAIGKDPSYPDKELFRYALAGKKDIEEALQCAERVFPSWSSTSVQNRSLLLSKIAQKLRENRKKLIEAMLTNTGKTVIEADIEFSEAIDFAEYYRRNIEELHCFENITWKAKGTVLIASPWNFPCSIPAGGILAALAAGNCVIFKPAGEAILVGGLLAEIFWQAGVNKEVLQFIACEDHPIGSDLIKDPRLATVILTGATSTAKHFLNMRPSIDLMAETGGKNTLIITALSDRDLAIKDLVSSAFGHAGQKCSACSLAILEAEVYDDPHFRRQLCDAVKSLIVGSPWDLRSKIPPLIHAPQKDTVLYRALTTLEPGEEWLLKPIENVENPHLWSPGIKLGVQPQSFTHQTEFFGPVLGLMRADSLSHAIELANDTPYGLTAGIHTLDSREKESWEKKIQAGNCYVNRSITGAIVQRQPFGGCKESSFGPGVKAGGPNYLIHLMHITENQLPKERAPLFPHLLELANLAKDKILFPQQHDLFLASISHYTYYWNCYFSKDHDPSNLLGEDNLLRYRPYEQLLLRTNTQDDSLNLLRAIGAALIVGCPLEVSYPSKPSEDLIELMNQFKMPLTIEGDSQFVQRLHSIKIRRIRMFSPPSKELEIAFAQHACNVKVAPMLANGRIELLNFLREISVSVVYHRYGNLGEREGEKRRSLPKK